MATLIDRGLQHYILTELSMAYPKSVDYSSKGDCDINEYKKYVANLAYLQEHGLIKHALIESKSLALNQFVISSPAITAKGMDFLANDGGLSAILNTVTVKIEANQLRDLIQALVASSDLNPENKQSMIDALRELPAESIRHLITKVVDSGWDSLPALMTVIQNILLAQSI